MRASFAVIAIPMPFLGLHAAAQAVATHDVRVTIPVLLRLRIEGAEGSTVDVSLGSDIAAANARFEPDHTRVHILANTRWQLTAAFAPAPGSERLALGYAVDDGPVIEPATAFAQVILLGEATAGWRERVVRYALTSVPAEGNYGGVITYTLSRP